MRNKKSVAAITFHAAYNYGSCLQAFALQKVVEKMGFDYTIINLRKKEQKDLYPDYFKRPFSSLKSLLMALYLIPLRARLRKKQLLFERFINERLNVTPEYTCLSAIQRDIPIADYYLTGSDQVWNQKCPDFDFAYFLPFGSGKKIAYAPSMSMMPSEEDAEYVGQLLSSFDSLSVREAETADMIEKLCGIRPEIVIDPTLLLSQQEWSGLVSAEPKVKGKYIFLYTPYLKEDIVEIAFFLSKKLGLKVVLSNLFDFRIIYLQKVKSVMDCGPMEFLNLIKHASLVCSGSFHAIIFSILFKVPFFAVNGDKDKRMYSILQKLDLAQRTIGLSDMEEKSAHSVDIDFSVATTILSDERERSLKYLMNALDKEEFNDRDKR